MDEVIRGEGRDEDALSSAGWCAHDGSKIGIVGDVVSWLGHLLGMRWHSAIAQEAHLVLQRLAQAFLQ